MINPATAAQTPSAHSADRHNPLGAGQVRYGNLRKAHEAAGSDCPAWEALWPAATAAMVEKFDPIRNLDRFGERPCLLLNGAADPLVPTVSNANLVGALQAAGHYSTPHPRPPAVPPSDPCPSVSSCSSMQPPWPPDPAPLYEYG